LKHEIGTHIKGRVKWTKIVDLKENIGKWFHLK